MGHFAAQKFVQHFQEPSIAFPPCVNIFIANYCINEHSITFMSYAVQLSHFSTCVVDITMLLYEQQSVIFLTYTNTYT